MVSFELLNTHPLGFTLLAIAGLMLWVAALGLLAYMGRLCYLDALDAPYGAAPDVVGVIACAMLFLGVLGAGFYVLGA